MDKIIKKIIKEANRACKMDEVPIGCVIVKNNKIISKAHNTKRTKNCCLNHAEIIAIKKASKKIKDWRLSDCSLYVTLEPCSMCMEVIRQCRIKKVYYLLESNYSIKKEPKIYKEQIKDYQLEKQCYKQQIQSFFSDKR